MIHLCDKLPDALSRFMDVLIGVEVNFFFLEGSDQPFGVPVLPRTPSPGYGNLNAMMPERREIGISKILNPLIRMMDLWDASV